jgi:hypothetical protein
MSVLLRLHGLWTAAEAQTRRLLRVLLIRLSPVPADPAEREVLLAVELTCSLIDLPEPCRLPPSGPALLAPLSASYLPAKVIETAPQLFPRECVLIARANGGLDNLKSSYQAIGLAGRGSNAIDHRAD